MRRLSTVALLVLCLTGLAYADLAAQVDAIISKALAKKVRFSIHIVEADSGRTVYDHNARELMIPASNMKLMVSATALKYLGPDYVYKTRVGLCGDTLVVIGSGDPLLGDERTDKKYGREPGWVFKEIIHALNCEGVDSVQDIIVDSSIFDNERVHSSWPRDDLNKWYACEISGINYNDNCVVFCAENVDGKVSVFVEPRTSFVTVVNEMRAITAGVSTLGSNRTSTPNKVTAFGRCKDKVGPIDVAIERPAAYFGFLLAEQLAGAGIVARGQLIEKALADDSDFVLLTEFSTPIEDCLARCNKDSLSLAAEALLKTVGAAANPDGKGGSWQSGREQIAKYLSGLGIEENQFYLDDGTGLSRQNELTAYAITTVLSDVYHGDNWPFYRDTLAVGGVEGTIAKYFKDKKYGGRIRGKTGYINGVKSFSGVCDTDSGDYLFSILANNAHNLYRTTINKIAEAIIDCNATESH